MTQVLDKVLIVDDDAEIRDLLGHYLREQGYEVSLAAGGEEMWAVLKSGEPDIIVLDLMLPGDDGLMLCRNLRARAETPVIMLTARGDETDRIEARPGLPFREIDNVEESVRRTHMTKYLKELPAF